MNASPTTKPTLGSKTNFIFCVGCEAFEAEKKTRNKMECII